MSRKRRKHRIQHTPSLLSFVESVPVASVAEAIPMRTAPYRLVKVLTWAGWSLFSLFVGLMLTIWFLMLVFL